MTRRTRFVIFGGAILLLVILVAISLRGCGNNKKSVATAPPDPPASTSALKRVEAAFKSALSGLTSRVETLEKKPDKVGVSASTLKNLDRRVEGFEGEVGDINRRLESVENRLDTPPDPPPPAVPSVDEGGEDEGDLPDAEAERRFVEALKAKAREEGRR